MNSTVGTPFPSSVSYMSSEQALLERLRPLGPVFRFTSPVGAGVSWQADLLTGPGTPGWSSNCQGASSSFGMPPVLTSLTSWPHGLRHAGDGLPRLGTRVLGLERRNPPLGRPRRFLPARTAHVSTILDEDSRVPGGDLRARPGRRRHLRTVSALPSRTPSGPLSTVSVPGHALVRIWPSGSCADTCAVSRGRQARLASWLAQVLRVRTPVLDALRLLQE